ncbi:hypothetical protein IMSHALPRED_004580 [Imshaugia aleurites]|uniref:Clr5 domain-containing protein n=1 Tax=Imshaugia aleurites TaxID=172621 RepID=A0A8H3F943_9LECA|nr:hypothetical protein IMSHALPRED_004580 [Imshaugia aleurites]
MYITEKKGLEEIQAFYREQGFNPSKRAFQCRFKEWGFPAKHHPAHRDADLAARIRELWEVNTSNKQMLSILRGEGWDVKERELTKLRKDHNLLLREPNKNGNGSEKRKKRKRDALEELADQNGQDEPAESPEEPPRTPSPEPILPAEVIAKRQARQARLLAESQERLKAGTRRRRTKVWSGLPPDPVQPPRYPSELTMEESKKELGLDKHLYQEMRNIFEDICRSNNVVKKTLCGGETWKAVKEQLISQFQHLQPIFWGIDASHLNTTQKPMALDLICMDVTKKIRTVGTRITISDAKNILGVTPQEGRDIRSAFDAILKGDHFVSKLEVPKEHWDALKAKWVAESPRLQQVLAGGDADPDLPAKLRALESIASDVQKRHRDFQTKKDPTRLTKTPATSFPGRGPPARSKPTSPAKNNKPPPAINSADQAADSPVQAFLSGALSDRPTNDVNPTSSSTNDMTTFASQALAHAPYNDFSDFTGMQIDPSLLEAAGSVPQSLNNDHAQLQNDVRVFFRPSSTSQLKHLHSAPKVWLGVLQAPYTVNSLRTLALSGSGLQGNARVGKIEGVADGDSGWGIDEDDELEAYLGFLKGGGKITFVVEFL